MKSNVQFLSASNRHALTGVGELNIEASFKCSRWYGAYIEVCSGINHAARNIMLDRHVIGMNLSSDPVEVDVQSGAAWRPVVLLPGSLWVVPECRSFSMRPRHGKVKIAHIGIRRHVLESALGKGHDLRMEFGLNEPRLTALYQMIIETMMGVSPNKVKIVESLVLSFMLLLGENYGVAASECRGGISSYRLNSLLKWLQSHLDQDITVPLMAALVGISEAHFSREFRRAMGVSPWEYVLEMRLERVRNLLINGQSVKTAASMSGFHDRAYLSRVFKRRVGCSPSSLTKDRPSIE